MQDNPTTHPTEAKVAIRNLAEGDIIRVPQYKNALEVTYIGESLIGVEFSQDAKKTTASKSLVINQYSGRVYLIAGTSDKGEVKTIQVVASRESDSESKSEQ